MSGRLFLCATPIGNLKDITLRALDVLAAVPLIAAEDTRHTRQLLNHFQIKTALTSYHRHNEQSKSEELIAHLKAGRDLALVSDAGLPGISDPGEILVKKAVQEDINIEVIPGAVAFVSGLVISGLPTAPVYFTGFLPSSGKGRRDALVKLKTIAATQVFYEAPHRIEKCLEDVRAVYGDVQVVIARELTKLHQELIRGTVSEVLDGFSHKEPRGEMVVYLSPPVPEQLVPPEDWTDAVMRLTATGISKKEALKILAEKYNIPKRDIYNSLLRPEST